MNVHDRVEEIYQEIWLRELFAKYRPEGETHLLQAINFRDQMNRFSWGMLFLYIYVLGRRSKEELPISIAADMELICLSSRILDDVLDEDNSQLERCIGRQNTLFLFTELLITSLRQLQAFECRDIGYMHLHSALQAEWLDVNRNMFDEISEQQYIKKILPKSSAMFKFVTAYADSNHQEFWDEFWNWACMGMQLSNDLSAIYNDEKSDLIKLKPTLPLLKTFDVSDEARKLEIRAGFMEYASGKGSVSTVREFIEAQGALEYCLILRELCKERCLHMLQEQFPEQTEMTGKLLAYLNMVAA
ncbi:hypothetical protein AB4Z30_18760 [Paenibacillus sp. 2TAF8]|uniref:hypothetical protein n=1 Tax=Paenibacillus sp. 2TAF8 TaxID=3233020 RepID=UPI003F99A9B2